MSRLLDLSPGPLQALTEALDRLTMPAPEVLLTGQKKVILIGWFGNPAQLDDFDPSRGDGLAQILLDTDPGYQMIPGPFSPGRQPGLFRKPNIRMGVPFWLLWARTPSALMERPDHAITLAIGHIHPLYNSATADVYDPETGEHQCRRYVMDYRLSEEETSDPKVSLQQQDHLRKLGGQPPHGPAQAPHYQPMCLA